MSIFSQLNAKPTQVELSELLQALQKSAEIY